MGFRSIAKKKSKFCKTDVEFRKGTFFSYSTRRLWILKILIFVNLWVDNASQIVIKQQASISNKTSVDWSSFCREVVFEAFLRHPEAKLVEIDESKFGKRKYHRGHNVEGQSVGLRCLRTKIRKKIGKLRLYSSIFLRLFVCILFVLSI